jgi:eukaryotic-like serine/threonine-protein kinase
VRNGEFVKGQPIPGTRYRVLDLVGVGGMGSVYEVEHLELGKRFVLKALLSDLALREDLVARLRNEQRALGRLEHPNIVAVTDAGATSGNVPYFVMERLDGETLAQRLRRVRRLSPVEALRTANGVLEGLTAAHEIGVVHRDIKPPNIFLAGGSRPKILDFGVAKIADARGAITARGVAVGTPRYMSPEQASGESVDGRSDLYAVGLILFEMITGAGPFDDARDANEMLLAHLGRVPARLSARAPNITPELDGLVASLLAKDPDSRPPNARTAAARVRSVERAYGASVVADAPTPFASEPPPPPGMTPNFGVTAPGSLTDDITRAQTTSELKGAKDTLIDDRGSTLSEGTVPAGLLTSAPSYGTRTELLPAVTLPASGNTETNTRVPVTPADGERTLEPVPVDTPPRAVARGSVGRRLLVVAGAVLLLFGFVLAARATFGGADDGARLEKPASAAPALSPTAAVVAAGAPGVRTLDAQRSPLGSAEPPSSTRVAAPPPPPAATRPTATPAGAPGPAKSPPVARSALPDPGLTSPGVPKTPKKSAKNPAVTPGLPGSGL